MRTITIQKERPHVNIDGRKLYLRPAEMEIFWEIFCHPEGVTQDYILSRNCCTGSFSPMMSRLRKALAPHGLEILQRKTGKGPGLYYLFDNKSAAERAQIQSLYSELSS